MARCRGTSRQSGERCRLPPTPGTEYCRFHGGRVPRGAAHHAYRDGSRSRFSPPATLLEDYERSRQDPRLTRHGDSIALLDAMIQQGLNEYEEGGAPELWREISRVWRRLEAARATQNRQEWGEAYTRLGTLLEQGVAQVSREGKLLSLLEHRRKQADSETRRHLATARVVTAEQAKAFFEGLGASVRRHVVDESKTREQVLDALLNDMTAIAYTHGLSEGAGE